MKKSLITIGALIILMAIYSGFPPLWSTVFYVVAGFLVILLGVIKHRETGAEVSHKQEDTFIENKFE